MLPSASPWASRPRPRPRSKRLRPVLCLITDRRRLSSEDELVARIGAAARAGVHLVQVRERDLDGGLLLHLVRRCVAATRGTATRVLVNERLDVALAAGADGVHLRSDSLSARRARAISPAGFVIGRSVHDVDAAHRAADDGADYLLFGTVFESRSKPGRVPSGLPQLAAVAAATSLPVLAVGGITVDRIEGLRASGAAGVAGIGLFAEGTADRLPALVETLTRAFDTSASQPDNKPGR